MKDAQLFLLLHRIRLSFSTDLSIDPNRFGCVNPFDLQWRYHGFQWYLDKLYSSKEHGGKLEANVSWIICSNDTTHDVL